MSTQSKRYFNYLALLLLLGALAFLVIQYKTISRAIDNDDNLADSHQWFKPFKQWYQINWHQQAIGWASVELEKTNNAYVITEQDAIEGRVNGERLRFEFSRKLYFKSKAPYRLFKGAIDSIEPQLTVNKSFKNGLEHLAVIETRNGKTSERQQAAINYNLKDYLSLRQFIRAKPANKALHISKELNNDDLGLHYSRYEVLKQPSSTKKAFVLRHQLQNSSKIKAEYLSEASSLNVSSDGVIKNILKPNGMHFIASKLKVSLNPEMQKDLYLSSGIPIDKPLGEPKTIKKLLVSLSKGSWKLMSINPARLSSDLLVLTPGMALQSKVPTQIQKPRMERSTGSQALFKLYQSLSLDTVSDAEKVKKLVTFVNEYLEYQVLPANFNLDDVLTSRVGDCSEHALLLSELLRYAQIPARHISGLVYLGDEEQRFGGHVWVEAYYDGAWHPVDPTWNLIQTTATHIPLVIGAHKSPKALLNALKLELKLEKLSR